MGTVSSSTSTASGSVSGFFYSPSANALTIQPSQSDSVSIPENIYNECEAAMAGGSTIQNFNGLPMIVNPVSLTQAQASQIAALQSSYQAAISAPVSFKNAAGVTSTYAFGNTLTMGGTNAQELLTQILAAGTADWKAGVWFDTAGVAQTMTFADLQGLAAAFEAMETPDEQNLMTKIAEVQAATTVAAVEAITF